MANQVSGSVYRIDKFAVPQDVVAVFLERLRWVDRALGAMPGCRQNLVLTQVGDTSEFNVATVVEWASADAMAAARALIQKRYAEEGFDPPAFMQGLGVKADMGSYGGA
ncbi:antibiotic biosynthesis monooxygenase [Variovorax sp. M-6]|uniref:antibiotic biosynthesis monooxygenase n=1 Tax=Variovorax sp. M-6 TaxID=3233041 RepID=UPI003F9A484C